MRRFEMVVLWKYPDILSGELVVYGYDPLTVCVYILQQLRALYGDAPSSFPRCFFLEEI